MQKITARQWVDVTERFAVNVTNGKESFENDR